ncbi:hypothetical protein COSO111634_38455 [Corallococcus soli]
MTRARSFTRLTPPTRSNSRSWRTRKSFAWSISDMSPISSRNTVPSSASSNLPGLPATAPVKAPFSWPNSSLSRSVSTMAEQLMPMKGRVSS